MTWEETILSIRKDENYKDLVEKAYFDEDLKLNIERFSKSNEFEETLKIIYKYAHNARSILDIGSGNGISSINFALKGYYVTALEPDSSDTVGAGAIKILKKQFNLNNINVYEAFAENTNFESDSFDVVYVRQAMHHANNLDKFVQECIRVLKPNGLFLTIRDHVVYDEKDKEWFLESHPLHKFYGGENAFTANQYKNAIVKAGAEIVRELKYFDSVINYFPTTDEMLKELTIKSNTEQRKRLVNKLGILVNNRLSWNLYRLLSAYKPLNEAAIPGRMYSFIAIKK